MATAKRPSSTPPASERVLAWKQLVTDWTAWGTLVSSPSTYLMVLAVVATIVSKAVNLQALKSGSSVYNLPLAVASDVALYMSLAVVLAFIEARIRFSRILTVPIAVLFALIAVLNSMYLLEAGEQASWSAVNVLIKDFADVQMVMGEKLNAALLVQIVVGVVVLAATPVLLGRFVRKYAGPVSRRAHGQTRAACALFLAVPALLVAAVVPRPSTVDLRSLSQNAVMKIATTASHRQGQTKFKGWSQKTLVERDEIDRFTNRRQPNILVYLMESTRYDHTSLAPESMRLAETPHLAELGQRGVTAHSARSFLPHTTKSLFSMLCGRVPTMQRGTIEVSRDPDFQCLPDILREAGYESAFFQSAFGTFEHRPRLVHKSGYRHFEAWEDIQAPILGYLASEDESLVDPLGNWLDDRNSSAPFVATLLTSATHHPYKLGEKLLERRRDAGKKEVRKISDRYAALVEEEDRILGDLVATLEERELLDDTIIVVVGDHGEGFGDHAVRQHDNNYFEEGLRVPFVISGPGVEPKDLYENVSLIDLTPTLLGVLDIEASEAGREAMVGFDITAPDFSAEGEPRFFGCYDGMKCRGYVVDDYKVIYVPETDEMWAFDLKNDPREQIPVVPDEAASSHLPRLHELMDSHRAHKYKYTSEKVQIGEWKCAPGHKRCKHPKAFTAAEQSKLIREVNSKGRKKKKGKKPRKRRPKPETTKPESN